MPEELENYSQDKLVTSFEKMSKSKGIGTVPSVISQKYGVDSMRMGILFGAPPEKDLNFEDKIISNMKSFLDRVYNLKLPESEKT